MTDLRTKLSSRLSAALDVARSLTVIYVVVHHVVNARGASHGLGLMFRFGQEAVVVFFLLSGFLIFANERRRALSPTGYYWRRLRRIYPALLIAMAVSALVAHFDHTLLKQFRPIDFFGTLLSLQDSSALKPGVVSDPFLNNDPLWSLSYEVAFYLAFPVVLKAWTRNTRVATAAIGLSCCTAYITYVVWPNHLSLVAAYFLVWWTGAMAANAYMRGASDYRSFLPPLYWLGVLCVIAVTTVEIVGYKGFGYYPFLPFRHFAVALGILMLFSNRLGATISSWCVPLAKPAAFMASISYGIYVLHYPILVSWSASRSPSGFAFAGLILILVAYLADRQLNQSLPRAPRV